MASLEFYLTVPDGDLEFEIFESTGNLVSYLKDFLKFDTNAIVSFSLTDRKLRAREKE